MRRAPWVNWGLIAANVVVFIFTSGAGEGTIHGSSLLWGSIPNVGNYALDPQQPALFQYFTYQFLHENLLHLGGNMLFLYIFGNNLNDRLGQLGYLVFYLSGGVIAGVGHAMTTHSPVIGASGSVAAVTGAYLILFPRSTISVLLIFFYIGTFEIPSLWFVLFSFSQDVIGQVHPEWLGGSEAVAHMAHISGTLFGAMLCMGLLSLNLLPRDQFDIMAMISRWNRRRQYRQIISQGYDPFAYTPPKPSDVRSQPPAEPDPRNTRMLELRAEISEAIAHHNLPHAAYLFLELKKLDPAQVLSRQAQLDVSNQLASQQDYPQASVAYEQFLTHFPNFEQIEQVELMLGVIYARYLGQYNRARQLLLRALARLHTEREIQWARAELARIEPLIDAAAGANAGQSGPASPSS